MFVDRSTLVFFDASAFVAAAGSREGGSSFLLTLCRQGYLRGAASVPVLSEAARNIDRKLPTGALLRFHRLLSETAFLVAPVPLPSERTRYTTFAVEDDHVVASCVASQAEYLITLDRRLLSRLAETALPFQAMLRGTFIKEVLVTHADYPPLRT